MLHNYLKHFRELGVQEALASIPHVSGCEHQQWQHAPQDNNATESVWMPLCVQQLGCVFYQDLSVVQVYKASGSSPCGGSLVCSSWVDLLGRQLRPQHGWARGYLPGICM